MPNSHPASSASSASPFKPGEEVMLALPAAQKRRAKIVHRHTSKPELYYIRLWFPDQERWAKGMRTVHQKFLEKVPPRT